MSDCAIITVVGRVASKELELKQGKNSSYVYFCLAVNKGYGENAHANFYSCVAYGDLAERIVKAKVRTGSYLRITADQDLEEFKKDDGSTGWNAKLRILDWNYISATRPKEDEAEDNASDSYSGFTATEDCGDNGLPFD